MLNFRINEVTNKRGRTRYTISISLTGEIWINLFGLYNNLDKAQAAIDKYMKEIS